MRERLARWYDGHRRTLPWREDPTPYRVWVSEIMLQQTQVATVLGYFDRFMTTFPTVAALAEAPEDQVLTMWAGLGYYRRCRMLHQAAGVVADELGGVLPDTAAGLQRLPGVGRYTAAAIASIAYGEAAAVLDGNVIRVLSRLMALETLSDSTAGLKLLWDTAERLLDPLRASAHNQAMMELGALVCTPKQPRCEACPLRQDCAAHAAGTADRYPQKKPRKRATAVRGVAGFAVHKGRVLLARRPDGGLLGGLWELPGGPLASARTPRRPAVANHLRERLGLDAAIGSHLATVEHLFTHRHLTLDVY
ncbi:MAG: A/G-specific adenine glycosylase, partial [Myxococcota bacterium]